MNKTKKLINFLLEDNPPPAPKSMADSAPVHSKKDASLDQVIDRYIIRYERESIPNGNTYENEVMYNEGVSCSKLLEFVLTEAEDDEEGGLDLGGEDTDTELDAPPDDSGESASTEEAPKNQPVVQTPQINLQNFAKACARLVNNYDTLMNPKDIILNRIEAYMVANYDERIAKELMDMLDQNYSLRTKTPEEQAREDQNEYPTHYSSGALATG